MLLVDPFDQPFNARCLKALSVIENFHMNARKIAGSVVPAAVLAAGVSSASTNPHNQMAQSNFQMNSLDTSAYFPQQGFGAYDRQHCLHVRGHSHPFFSNPPVSPNLQRKAPAPMPNAMGSRDPPMPPSRPNFMPSGPMGNPTMSQYVSIIEP